MTKLVPLQQQCFFGLEPGPHLVVLGAVHGNEYCGPEAIWQAIEKLQAGEIVIERGSVSFVPVASPKAYAQRTRFVERNLNRHFYPKEQPEVYEDALNAVLCPILDQADFLLDLHSYQSQGGPFCFLGTTSQAEIDYCRDLGVDLFIYGWADAFSKDATEEQKRASIGTTDYVRLNGCNACAVTIECGHHDHPDNAKVGYEAIIRALSHAGLIADAAKLTERSDQQICVQMRDVYYKERSGSLAQPWKHGDQVAAGQVIAAYDDGEALTAPCDGVIILPKTATDQPTGAEWFYFGVPTAFPER